MEILYRSKKKTRLGDVGNGVLVSIDKITYIVINPCNINEEVESYITDDFDFYELGRVAVVDLRTGNMYWIPEDEECEVITDYTFEVNNL
jgi:hypothetical protein